MPFAEADCELLRHSARRMPGAESRLRNRRYDKRSLMTLAMAIEKRLESEIARALEIYGART